jgi:hypothetical protein
MRSPKCTPTKPWLQADVAGRWRTNRSFGNVTLEANAGGTSVDVYGRPWMAPRAGSKIERKFVMRKSGRPAMHADTPTNTPES